MRKVATSIIMIVAPLSSSLSLRSFLLLVVMNLSLVVHVHVQPYKNLGLNRLELFALSCNVICLLMATFVSTTLLEGDSEILSNQYTHIRRGCWCFLSF